MRKSWDLSAVLFVLINFQLAQVACAQAGASPQTAQETIVFDTFQATALDKKREYGLGIDQFFGALVRMQKAGQHSRENPMPLLQKTLAGLSNNDYDSDTLKIILFYFSRLALKNPPVIQAYKEELLKSDDFSSAMLSIILWYARDREMQTAFRQVVQESVNPRTRELLREIYQDRTFINILPETMPIKSCQDIEILWAEYFIKGDLKAIERIAEQVTARDEDLQQALISVEAGSSLAQRGGWFGQVRAMCESKQAESSGRDRQIWTDIIGRMKPLGDGTEVVNWPIKRIKLNGKEGRAMACEAVFPKKNDGLTDVLGAYSLKADNIRQTRKILFDYWFNGGRFELLMSMEGLATGGHRASFDRDVKQIVKLNDSQRELFISRQPLLSWPRWRIVCDYGPRLGSKSILAWDLSRICMLGRFGYEAQYLTPQEVYRVSIPAAIVLQQTFASWEDYGENFWIGRWYWRAEEKDRDEAKKAVEALLTEEKGPWKKYPWGMPMK